MQPQHHSQLASRSDEIFLKHLERDHSRASPAMFSNGFKGSALLGRSRFVIRIDEHIGIA